MLNQATELEIIMREALLEHGFFFDEQVYVRKDRRHFEFDFVVYGDYCKVVVECDGPHHNYGDRWYKDLLRDLWTVNNDFQDVLRFDYYQLRNDIDGCIQKVKGSITELNEALRHDSERRTKLNSEKEKIKKRKNSPFYEGENPYHPLSGLKVKIPQKSKEEIEKRQKLKQKYSEYDFNSSIQMMNNINKNTQNIKLSSFENKKFKITQSDMTFAYRTEEPIEVEHGLMIPRGELRFYKLIKSLCHSDKKVLWMLMKGATNDGYYVYKGSKQSIRNLISTQLLEINPFYITNKKEVSVKVLPEAPYLLKAYLNKKLKASNRNQ